MRRFRNNLTRAAVISLGVHGALLATMAIRVQRREPAPGGAAAFPLGWGVPAEAPPEDERTFVDLRAVEVDPLALPPPDPPRAAGDTAVAGANVDPSRGAPYERRAAAQDSGDAGRVAPVAHRRDRATLKARLTDGADTYQPSRERTSSRPSSPQAVRQEQRVGIGDSSRDRTAGAAALAPPAVDKEKAEAEAPVPKESPLAALSANPGPDPARGEGPLDAVKGERRFDTEVRGQARDSAWVRAGSNERHPGLIDLSAPAAPGAANGEAGKGAGEAPGAVARPEEGAAPATRGGAVNGQGSASGAVNLGERQYSRQELEIRRRVASMLLFPRKLALMLEQGETIIHFVVRPDGRLAGRVQVVKSAGFDEFDREAVSAVERAAPFPRMERPLSVSMRIPFQNPVIR